VRAEFGVCGGLAQTGCSSKAASTVRRGNRVVCECREARSEHTIFARDLEEAKAADEHNPRADMEPENVVEKARGLVRDFKSGLLVQDPARLVLQRQGSLKPQRCWILASKK